MRKKIIVFCMIVALVVIIGGINLVQDEATAIMIATKTFEPHANKYPIIKAKREDDHWVVSFSMGDDYLGGVVIIYVNQYDGTTGAIHYLK